MPTSIISIATANPAHTIAQKEIADIFSRQAPAGYADVIKPLFCRAAITNRYSILPLTDWDKSATTEKVFFHKNGAVPSIDERIALHQQHDVPLAVHAIDQALEQTQLHINDITHLITVTSTGVRCPGLDAGLSVHYNMPAATERFHIHFGGCHAGMQALRQANHICRSDAGAVVLVVCVELHSLYFKEIDSQEQLILNSLFADGACAAILVNDDKRANMNLPGFVINTVRSVTLPGTADGILASYHAQGFNACLSPNLAGYIAQHLPAFIETNLWLQNLQRSQVDYWCVHPGGKKILDAVCSCLSLEKDDLSFSYEVLRHHGNMESVSIYHVLKNIWKDFIAGGNETASLCALGFGPGVTVELMLMEAVCPAPGCDYAHDNELHSMKYKCDNILT